MRILLASASPRRQEILRQMGLDFTVFVPDVDESYGALEAEKVPEFLARKKLAAVLSQVPHECARYDFTLAADTVIVLNGVLYGKPADRQEAKTFLRQFSGQTHRVITAVAVYERRGGAITVLPVASDVTFCRLSDADIESYLDCREWQDAAGAYKIQGKGACFVSRLNGSYSGIVGLPVFELFAILKKYGAVFTAP